MAGVFYMGFPLQTSKWPRFSYWFLSKDLKKSGCSYMGFPLKTAKRRDFPILVSLSPPNARVSRFFPLNQPKPSNTTRLRREPRFAAVQECSSVAWWRRAPLWARRGFCPPWARQPKEVEERPQMFQLTHTPRKFKKKSKKREGQTKNSNS